MQRSYKLFETVATSLGSRWVTDGVTLSGAGTTYSNVMTPDQFANLGFTVESTGTLAGTITLWYSDEDNPSLANDDDWDQDTSWSPTAIAGAATKEKYVVTGLRAKWARLKFVYSAGSGVLKGYHS